MTRADDTLRANDEAIARAAAVLRAGGLVAFPTETVYGLGANALDAVAVAKVFEAKGRPTFDPLIVHVATPQAARELVAAWPETAERLAAAFWPGPLTMVLARRGFEVPRSELRAEEPAPNLAPGTKDTEARIADLVTSGLSTVGVRVPRHPVALRLLEAAGVPVAAPSANRFGAISPTRAEHVASELGERVDLILDGGPCETGVESTVVSLVGEAPVVLRLGGTAVEEIERVLGRVEVATKPGQALGAMASPGMLERHYAPRTKLVMQVAGFGFGAPSGLKVGLLAFSGRWPGFEVGGTPVEVLSPSGDLREAAANLFSAMRRLDEAGVDLIVAEPVPEEGLGRAINDRLRRAAAGRDPGR